MSSARKRAATHKANKEAWVLRARLELAERQCAELRQFAEIAALMADTEREACAKVCENNDLSWADHEWNNAVADCATKIRARGEQGKENVK